MLPVYEKLFNIILNTGIVPDTWTVGIIHSIYKYKGDSKDPSNYRPFSLISCFSKVFTSIINNRLTSYVDQVHLISESQSGFRKMHSTTDNIFILHSLVNLYPTKKKRLFCTFVDFSKAFDQVNRSFLWVKMLKSNISGNCFNMIKNMYQNIKSCVYKDDSYSDLFSCNIGVRQKEHLSPFLFAVFLNDLESYLEIAGVSSLDMADALFYEQLDIYMKIFIILYADDTLLFSESLDGMQSMLDELSNYCKIWKLEVNTSEIKLSFFRSVNTDLS